MHYNSLHPLPPQDDLVDERWDDNRECYNQPESTLKNLDVLFQNLNLNRDQHRTTVTTTNTTPIQMKKVSPLDVSYEKNNFNNDGLCFKEDMTSDDDDDDDDDDNYNNIVDNKMYFKQHNNTCYPSIKIDLATPIATPIATTPLTTPSMITEAEEKHEYLATTYITQPTDQEDFSIMPLNEVEDYEEVNEELTLDECVTATTSDRLPPSFDDDDDDDTVDETNVYSTSPFNLCTYHSDLIQYYMDIILSKTAPDAISPLVTETLPDTYKQYLKDIQESCL
ncbi:MAG: hypothetical protein EXX96DRAFT_545948 [Benjaminiella poitrasii]|nr:MAG: hypothetical protein EXX96DRAFT_545948 [Benjaminiella poitrasii]